MSGVEEEDAREVVEVAPARGALGGAAAGSGMAGPQQLEGLRGREWQQEQQDPQQEQEQQQQEQQQEQERQQEQQRPSAAERVASGILLGGCVLAGLVRVASGSASAAVARYAEARMAAADRAEPPTRVSPHMQQGLQVAAAVASGAACVTGHIASAVGEASYALAQHIAAVSRENREQRRHEGHSAGSGGRRRHGRHSAAGARGEAGDGEARGGGDEGGQSALKTVGAAGLLAYVQIYDALEEAAKQVLAHSAEASAQYIGYKYGPEAAAAAQMGVPLAQNVVHTATNAARLAVARALVSEGAQRSAALYLQAALDPAALSPPEGAAALAAAAGGRPAGGIGAPAGLVGGGVGLRPLVTPIEMRAMPVA
ncbi:hypothetical protein MNEG_8742 [Monoraphidium neglectum]|uniref:Senescence domain-containing protein n=1 Tax=Monoraphidium neglectum TaxID=145388 RepID=A0A0D2MYJ5_9CHLO|nr:hypothetical protein MNEG_8742 [Monoraphidium neglectum]KIY99220.1 hypothetical protein MNEG_8742 [Monoraphidium neglectum]|eukprot:XP_013898240.1 hypothetical protein MNEG_8742 [Monoraphidium neglectum]